MRVLKLNMRHVVSINFGEDWESDIDIITTAGCYEISLDLETMEKLRDDKIMTRNLRINCNHYIFHPIEHQTRINTSIF